MFFSFHIAHNAPVACPVVLLLMDLLLAVPPLSQMYNCLVDKVVVIAVDLR
jgi:hypothetical protein